jgi:hypothetical protein
MAFHDPFDLDLHRAVREQLLEAFANLQPGALDEANISDVHLVEGVYQLYCQEVLVYVGKADNLRSRLGQHRRKLSGRQNIDLGQVKFAALETNPNWTALAPEAALIAHFTQAGLAAWNGNGYGNHDPGRNREERNEAPDGFDRLYPIRHDWSLSLEAGDYNVNELLQRVKSDLPFLLRYQTSTKAWRQGHPDYNNVTVHIVHPNMRINELLELIAQHAPGWQATRFSSHVIFYKENRQYAFGTRISQPAEL